MKCNYRSLRPIAALALTLLLAGSAGATISIGAWDFDDLAFADDATQIDAGDLFLYCDATDLDDALTGYSPDRMLVNIGVGDLGNHFQLDFTDLMAQNDAGGDIVFFDSRFSADPYEIAVRPLGGSFTAFVVHDAADFVDTGEVTCGTIFGLEIELDDFGIGAGVAVDAIQFRALPRDNGNTEGDPVMAAVLNYGPTATEEASWSTIKANFR